MDVLRLSSDWSIVVASSKKSEVYLYSDLLRDILKAFVRRLWLEVSHCSQTGPLWLLPLRQRRWNCTFSNFLTVLFCLTGPLWLLPLRQRRWNCIFSNFLTVLFCLTGPVWLLPLRQRRWNCTSTFSWCYFVWLAHCGYLSSVLIATSWSQAFVRLVHCGCLLAEEWSLYLYIVT